MSRPGLRWVIRYLTSQEEERTWSSSSSCNKVARHTPSLSLHLSIYLSLRSLGKYLFRKAKLHAPTKLSSIISMQCGEGRGRTVRGSTVTKRLHSLQTSGCVCQSSSDRSHQHRHTHTHTALHRPGRWLAMAKASQVQASHGWWHMLNLLQAQRAPACNTRS